SGVAGAEGQGSPKTNRLWGWPLQINLNKWVDPGSPKAHRLWGGVQANLNLVAVRRRQNRSLNHERYSFMQLPTPAQIKLELPLECPEKIFSWRKEAICILKREDPRLAL